MINKTQIQKLRKFAEDSKWIMKHYDSLKEQHPDEFVAALNRKVIGHNREIKSLILQLEKIYPEDARWAAIEFISSKKVEMILCL